MLDHSKEYAASARGRKLEAALDAYAKLDPPNARWLYGCDDGEDYCRPCADEQINYFDRGICVDGGCSSVERDTCCHCATCGQVLNYILTNHGVGSELQHFYRHRIKAPLHPEEAFHIARVLQSAPADKRAVRLGERALRAIQQPLI